MDQYKETFETWNKVAQLYQEKFMYLTLYDESYDAFYDLIKNENAKILDAGCGPGNISHFLLSKYAGLEIEGIDIAPNMIELARKNVSTLQFKILDLRNVNQLEKKYDGIICGFGLPYLSEIDCRKFIIDCFNLLSEKGVFYLSFVEGNPDQSGFKTASSGDRTYFHFYTLDFLLKLLFEVGFESPAVMKIKYNKSVDETEEHTILIAKKK